MLGSNLLQPAYYAVFASPLSAFSLIFADLMGRLSLDRLCELFLRCHDMLVGHRRRYGGIGPPPPQRKIGVEETLMSMSYPQFLLCVHLCISVRFNGHFPGESGLAGVYWSKG